MKPNRVKQLLKEGKYTCGSWVSLCSPIGAEIMGSIGFDWLLIDMEHSPGDYQTLLHQLQAIGCAGETVPFVRAPWNDPVMFKRILDTGAYGIMVPGGKDVDDAKRAVDGMKYPPQGYRGLAGNRGARFGMDPDYTKQANDEIMVVFQVETRAAVDNIESILDVPGIDVVFIGPNDLSGDMGYVGNWSHPEVQEAIGRVEAAATKRNIPLGTVSRNWEAAQANLDKGYRMMSIMGDIPYLISGARQGVQSFREHPNVAKANG